MSQARPHVLILHGFMGGLFEVEPLVKRLQANGWKTNLPLLPGNGTDRRFHNIRYFDWLTAAEEAAEQMMKHNQPFDLVGFSMGGLLAAYIANRYPVRRLVLLNAAVYYFSPGRFMKAIIKQLKKGDFSRIKKMRSTPFSLTVEFIKLAHKLYCEFSTLQVPTLVIQGMQDEVIHPASARWIQKTVSSCQQVLYFARSGHTICLEEERDEVGLRVEHFLT